MRNPLAREEMILCVQQDGVAESRCILQGVQQQLCVCNRLLSVRKSNAAGLGQHSQFSQFFSRQPLR